MMNINITAKNVMFKDLDRGDLFKTKTRLLEEDSSDIYMVVYNHVNNTDEAVNLITARVGEFEPDTEVIKLENVECNIVINY